MPRPVLLLACALAGLALAPASALAQAQAAPAAPSKAEIDRAANNLRVFVSALQSEQIPEVVKSALFACIYTNPFSRISEGTDKALAEQKVDKADPNNIVGAMAAVCGYRPSQAPAKK